MACSVFWRLDMQAGRLTAEKVGGETEAVPPISFSSWVVSGGGGVLLGLQLGAVWTWRLFWERTMIHLGCTSCPSPRHWPRKCSILFSEDSCAALFVFPCLLIGLACLRGAWVLIVSNRTWHAVSWEDCLFLGEAGQSQQREPGANSSSGNAAPPNHCEILQIATV